MHPPTTPPPHFPHSSPPPLIREVSESISPIRTQGLQSAGSRTLLTLAKCANGSRSPEFRFGILFRPLRDVLGPNVDECISQWHVTRQQELTKENDIRFLRGPNQRQKSKTENGMTRGVWRQFKFEFYSPIRIHTLTHASAADQGPMCPHSLDWTNCVTD